MIAITLALAALAVWLILELREVHQDQVDRRMRFDLDHDPTTWRLFCDSLRERRDRAERRDGVSRWG